MSFKDYLKEKICEKFRLEHIESEHSITLLMCGCVLMIVGGLTAVTVSWGLSEIVGFLGFIVAVAGAMQVLLVLTLYNDYLKWKKGKKCPDYVR